MSSVRRQHRLRGSVLATATVRPHVEPGRPLRLRTRVPDFEVRRLLRQMQLAKWGTQDLSVQRVRRAWQLGVKAFSSTEPVYAVEDRLLDTPNHRVPVRVYRPRQAQHLVPAIIWFHGGGFVFGGLDTADGTCRALANRTGACVISVDYRLTPEHTLRDAKVDSLAAAAWIATHAEGLGLDASQLAVGGDSAGGAWAALVAQEWPGPHPLVCQVLAYPATDLAGSYPSREDPRMGLTLDVEQIDWLQQQIRRSSSLEDPDFSPIHSVENGNPPPTVLLTTGFDALRDEDLAYAQRLLEHDVPVILLHYPGQVHGFLSLDLVLAGAVDALERLAAAYHLALDGAATTCGWDVHPPYGARRDRWRWLTPRQRAKELAVAWTVLREASAARDGRRPARRQAGAAGSTGQPRAGRLPSADDVLS